VIDDLRYRANSAHQLVVIHDELLMVRCFTVLLSLSKFLIIIIIIIIFFFNKKQQ